MAQGQGITSLMPGQAPAPGQSAQPMPGMQPPMGGPSAGVVDLVGPLKNLPEQVLTMELMNPQSKLEKYAVLAALDQKNRERKTMQAVQGMLAQQQNAQMQGQGTVAQQVAREAQQPVMAAMGGLMRSYAGGGGVVAFQSGGLTDEQRARWMSMAPLEAAPAPSPAVSMPVEDRIPVAAPLAPQTQDEKELVDLVKSLRANNISTADISEESILNSYRKLDPEFRSKRLSELRAAHKRLVEDKATAAAPAPAPAPTAAPAPAPRASDKGIATLLPPAPRPAPSPTPSARAQALSDEFASIGAATAAPATKFDISDPANAIPLLEQQLAKVGPSERADIESELKALRQKVAAEPPRAVPPGKAVDLMTGAVTEQFNPRFEPAVGPEALAQFKAAEQAQAASAPRRQDLGGGSSDIAGGLAGTMPPKPTSGVPALISDYMKTLKSRGESVGKLTEAEKGLDELMRRRIEQEEKFGRETLADTRRAAEEALARSKEFSPRDWFELAAAIAADPRRGREFGALGKGLASVTGRKEQEVETARKTLAAAGKDERALQLKTMEMNEALQKAQVERERGNVKRAEELEDKAMGLKLEASKYEDKLKTDQRELDIKELQAGKMNDIEFYLKHGADAYARYKTAGQKPVVPLTYENASEAADKFLGTLPGTTYVQNRQEEAKKAGQPVPNAVQIRQELIQQFLRDAGAPAGGATTPPAVGTVMQGYRFKGGDPSDKKNWEKV